ncbi:MAG: hypothetical protein JWN32_3801, partial [Solirubrobacterales bacterium]|nr:hypothetical protein [Solirubrobacterales bacterium]
AAVAVATATGVQAVDGGSHRHRHASARAAIVAPAVASPANTGGAPAPTFPLTHAPVEPATPGPTGKPLQKDKPTDKTSKVGDTVALPLDPSLVPPPAGSGDPNATGATGVDAATGSTDPNAPTMTTGTTTPGATTAGTGTGTTSGSAATAGTAPPSGSSTQTATGTQIIPPSGGASAPSGPEGGSLPPGG